MQSPEFNMTIPEAIKDLMVYKDLNSTFYEKTHPDPTLVDTRDKYRANLSSYLETVPVFAAIPLDIRNSYVNQAADHFFTSGAIKEEHKKEIINMSFTKYDNPQNGLYFALTENSSYTPGEYVAPQVQFALSSYTTAAQKLMTDTANMADLQNNLDNVPAVKDLFVRLGLSDADAQRMADDFTTGNVKDLRESLGNDLFNSIW